MRSARHPHEPWLHVASGSWCKKVAGKLHYLDRDYQTAKLKLAKLLRDEKRRESGAPAWLDLPFAQLCDEFLDDIKARREPATYAGYRYRLLRALKSLGPTLRVGELRRLHLSKIEQAMTGTCSPTTVRDTLATVQFVFEWAVRNDIVDTNPLRGYVKPAARQRSRVMTPQEFQTLLRASKRNAPFRRVLIALRHTGCRPKELRTLTWDMVDLDERLWIIPKHKTITTQSQPRPRIVPLPTCVWKLCRWLHQRRPQDSPFVFLNTIDKPYSRERVIKLMDIIRKRAEIPTKAGERLVLYSCRHAFGTESCGKVSDIELAEVLGHTDTRTTRRYVHLNAARLRDIQRRIEQARRAPGSA